MATHTCTMKSSGTSATWTVEYTYSSDKRKCTITIDLVLKSSAGSHNYDTSNNFYIKMGTDKSTYTVTKITSSGVTKSKSKTFTLGNDGTLKVALSVGGSLPGTSYAITGGNTATASLSGAKATYAVKYNANGGTGAPSAQTKTYGVTLKLSTTKPTRASVTNDDVTINYTFKGWATTNTATTAKYAAGASYTTNAAVTLYAVWSTSSTVNSFDVVYDTGDGSNIAPQEKTKGTALTLRTDVPTLYGYTFSGWSITDESTTISYYPGDSYSTDADLYLYAVWEPWTHEIIFENTGDYGYDLLVKTTDVNLDIMEDIPTKIGYIFRYWCSTQDGLGEIYNPGDAYIRNQDGGEYILYGIWSKKEIQLTSTNKIKAVEFVEDASFLGFTDNCNVYCSSFREGTPIKLGSNEFSFNEIIERICD